MLESLVDNIVEYGECIPADDRDTYGTNGTPLLAALLVDLFLHSYETSYLQGLLQKKEERVAGPSILVSAIWIMYYL